MLTPLVTRQDTRGAQVEVGWISSSQDAASVTAYRLYLILVVFTLLSIPNRLPALGLMRPTIALVALITVLILVSKTLASREHSRTAWLLNVILGYVLITLPFVQWPGSVLRFGFENWVKAIVFFYFTVRLINSYERLRLFLLLVVGCQVIRVLEPLYLHLTSEYWGSMAHMGGGEYLSRLAGAPSDIIGPNGLAFVILTAIPFMHYLLLGAKRPWLRLLYWTLIPLLLYALTLTGSRSGIVGLTVVVVAMLWRTKKRVAFLATVMLIAVGLGVGLSPDMRDRYLSLVDDDTRSAETRQGRVSGAFRDFVIAAESPLFGHGLGTSAEARFHAVGIAQISHNMYGEVAIELGFFGLALFAMFLVSVLDNIRSASRIIALGSTSSRFLANSQFNQRLVFYKDCAAALVVYVIMLLVFSLASYGLSEFYWYLAAGLSVVLVRGVHAANRDGAAVSSSGRVRRQLRRAS